MRTTHRPVGTRRPWRAPGLVGLALLITPVVGAGGGGADDPPRPALKTEHFDRDPGWEGFNNRVEPRRVPTVTQDFGYSPTGFAAREKGEVGGRVTRAARPAYYADRIPVKTLNDRLSASGTFALTASSAGGGVFFGWFNAEQPGGGGRPMNSLGMDFDGEKAGARLAVRMIGGTNRSCGTFVTPFVPGKYRPTPIRNDGTRYAWALNYDPEANGGKGRFEFSIKGDGAKPEEFEGKVFTVDLPDGFKKTGATFDHFGLMNLMKPGGALTIHFGDLRYDGKALDFSKDPGWEGSGNRATYADREQAGAHDFGFSPDTNFAGGRPGEVGGRFWRSGHYGYYADRIGPLSLDDRLEAGGKVVLKVGAPDSDMFLGWFNSAAKDRPPVAAGHFLGVHVGGPTRVGHYFHPSYTTARGSRGQADKGPVLVPGTVYEWSLVYDPAAGGGRGEIRVTLGDESVTLPLKAGDRAQGARLDRFGLFTSDIGGQLVRIYLDDLRYTAAPE
jgi:hypothetical protein